MHQETVEKVDYSSEINALKAEKEKIEAELEHMRKFHGYTETNTSTRGKQLNNRLYEIESEIRRLEKK